MHWDTGLGNQKIKFHERQQEEAPCLHATAKKSAPTDNTKKKVDMTAKLDVAAPTTSIKEKDALPWKKGTAAVASGSSSSGTSALT